MTAPEATRHTVCIAQGVCRSFFVHMKNAARLGRGNDSTTGCPITCHRDDSDHINDSRQDRRASIHSS
eukprot:3815350-Amphidinium_carterae.1